MLPSKEENIMINTNELANQLMTALDAIDTAKEMRAEMEASIIPMTIDAVNTMFQRIQNNIQPIVDAVSILCKDVDVRNTIIGAKTYSNYREGMGYVRFTIVDLENGVCIPVIPHASLSDVFYVWSCSKEKDGDRLYTTKSRCAVYSLCYTKLDTYVPAYFEVAMYEAVEAYVQSILGLLKKYTERQIAETNKLTETLRRIAGDDIVNEILYKNIHVGNGINGVRINDGKVVVDICGQEYILNATKM